MANREDYGWNWHKFKGSREALKWNRRDLPVVDAVLKQVPGRSVCLQAGGNLGLFPKRLAMDFQAVYTFEPDPANFLRLTQNCHEGNVVKIQAALGYKRQFVRTAKVRRDNKPGAKVHEGITHISGAGILPTLTIDDLALPVCDLIYLDTEGCELDALCGAVQTIARCQPVIAVELNKNLAFVGLTPADVIGWLASHGYQERAIKAHTEHSDHLFAPEVQAA